MAWNLSYGAASAHQEAEYSLGSGKCAQTHVCHLIIFLCPACRHVPACSRLHGGKLSSWWEEAAPPDGWPERESRQAQDCTPRSLQTPRRQLKHRASGVTLRHPRQTHHRRLDFPGDHLTILKERTIINQVVQVRTCLYLHYNYRAQRPQSCLLQK